jgi:hypothetical protein
MSRRSISGRRITGGFRSIEELRDTYRPGCQPHWIQVIKVAERDGRYEAGVLLGVDGMVAEVLLRRDGRVCRVGTLWPDRLARVALGKVRRDPAGRPIARWNRRVNVLQLFDLDPPYGRPSFNVVDLDAQPEYLDAWQQLPASRTRP